jgi:hypothetical protein
MTVSRKQTALFFWPEDRHPNVIQMRPVNTSQITRYSNNANDRLAPTVVIRRSDVEELAPKADFAARADIPAGRLTPFLLSRTTNVAESAFCLGRNWCVAPQIAICGFTQILRRNET